MIRELIRSWRTPASKTARTLGYLYESIAMQERYRRRQSSWQSHIAKCHEVTIREASTAKKHESLVILGSGPLNEIPMDVLCRNFTRIHLVDIVHPLEVRARWGKRPNVELHELDLTGVAKALLNFKGADLPSPQPPPLPRADFILSANCLSQLPLKPRQHVEALASAGQLDQWCEHISAAHLAQLKNANVPHLIITDFETDILDGGGNLLERSQPFFDVTALQLIEKWPWAVAPKGEFQGSKSVCMTVGAFKVSE